MTLAAELNAREISPYEALPAEFAADAKGIIEDPNDSHGNIHWVRRGSEVAWNSFDWSGEKWTARKLPKWARLPE